MRHRTTITAAAVAAVLLVAAPTSANEASENKALIAQEEAAFQAELTRIRRATRAAIIASEPQDRAEYFRRMREIGVEEQYIGPSWDKAFAYALSRYPY